MAGCSTVAQDDNIKTSPSKGSSHLVDLLIDGIISEFRFFCTFSCTSWTVKLNHSVCFCALTWREGLCQKSGNSPLHDKGEGHCSERQSVKSEVAAKC